MSRRRGVPIHVLSHRWARLATHLAKEILELLWPSCTL